MTTQRKRHLGAAVLLCAATLAAAATLSHGRVFRRWPAAAQSARAMEALGGVNAYETDITVNGETARLSVFAFAEPIARVAGRLARTFGAAAAAAAGERMSLLSADGGSLRFLLVQLDERPETLVFNLQGPATGPRSAAPPPLASLGSVPVYPGSEHLWVAENRGTGLSMAVSLARAPAEAVGGFFDERLSAAGWQRLTSGPGPLRVYLRKGEVCYAVLENAAEPGATRITLLHKPESME